MYPRQPITGPHKTRKHFTIYNITSHEFSTPGYTSIMLYPSGGISLISALSVPITRVQAAYVLAHAHDHKSCIVKRRDIL